MQFIDQKIAARMEATERLGQLRYAEALRRSRPEAGVAIEDVGGGQMVFTGVNSPIGRAIGLGLKRPCTSADIDRVEQFYFSRGADAQIDLVPAADESLFELVRSRPYRLFELNNVMALEITDEHRFTQEVPGVELRRAAIGDGVRCAGVLVRCFPPMPGLAGDTMAPMFEPPSLTFLAWSGGEPVGAAAGLIAEEEKLLALFGAGTLPEFRGRGIQTAMLGVRINAAADAGCTLAVTVTRGGATSQRNAERLGFRVAYSKATIVRSRQDA